MVKKELQKVQNMYNVCFKINVAISAAVFLTTNHLLLTDYFTDK